MSPFQARVGSPKTSEDGFSLVELLFVIGIIGILATIAMPLLRKFMIKARQAEMKTMAPHIVNLNSAYRDETGDLWPPVDSASGMQNSSIHIVNNDHSSSSSCVTDNPIGFSVIDCAALRFTYQSYIDNTGASVIIEELFLNNDVNQRRVFVGYDASCPVDTWIYGGMLGGDSNQFKDVNTSLAVCS